MQQVMANSIQVLKQTELCGRQFTVYGTVEEPLFRAKDVAEVINHNNISHMLSLVDDDEKGVTQFVTPRWKSASLDAYRRGIIRSPHAIPQANRQTIQERS
jgi:prophage antirepressor-like protein